MTFNRMPKRKFGFDPIVVPSAQVYPFDVRGILQVSDNPLDGSLSNAYHRCHFPHPNLWLPGDTKQHMGMVGAAGNIRIEVVCDSAIADAIAAHLQIHYYDNYAMILFVTDVAVLRPEKF